MATKKRLKPRDGWWVVEVDREPWAIALLLRKGTVVGGTAGSGNRYFHKSWYPTGDAQYAPTMSACIRLEQAIRDTKRRMTKPKKKLKKRLKR